MNKLFQQVFAFFASYGLAVAIFILFFLLILFGTLYQVDHGLYEAQTKYFSSMFVVHQLGPIAIPLPGGYLLMAVFGVNLICGGLVRMRTNWRRPGVLITHIGVLVMLASAGVTYHFSDRGSMTLYTGEMSDIFQSYHDWNIEIGKPAAGATLQRIPDKQIEDLGPGDGRVFYSDALPFEVRVSNYMANSRPVRASGTAANDAGVVDGFRLLLLPPEKESEQGIPGAYVSVTNPSTGETTDGILWGASVEPLTVRAGDVYYTLKLVHKTYKAPFVVRADEIRHIVHAGTTMAASYESDVTRIEGDSEEKVRIWMNHPLRRKGYTFFQTTMGTTPDGRKYTGFEVVRNPSDQWPLVSCVIVSIGMLVHFLQRLGIYMQTEARRRTE